MATEYRLMVRKWGHTKTYRKRDRAHAEKGLEDAYRDFDRYTAGDPEPAAWIESRTVTGWDDVL